MDRAAAELLSAAETVPGVSPRLSAMVLRVTLFSRGGPTCFFLVIVFPGSQESIAIRGGFPSIEGIRSVLGWCGVGRPEARVVIKKSEEMHERGRSSPSGALPRAN